MTKLYDKRDGFSIPIVNFPVLSSNNSSAPAYGVYVSQLGRYGRACCKYQDFVDRGELLTNKLLSQGYRKAKLASTVKTFYWRHLFRNFLLIMLKLNGLGTLTTWL